MLRRLGLWIICLFSAIGVLAAPAFAQTPAKNVGVFGDSLGDGVWGGMYLVAKQHPGYQLFRHGKPGAGISHPDFPDWLKTLPGMLDADHLDIAVVMFGANDQLALRDVDGKGYPYKSEGWTRVYTARMKGMMDEFATRKIAVLWLGLPITRKPDYNAGAVYLNQLYADNVAAAGGTFRPLIDDFRGADGNYAPYLPDEQGKMRQIRADDGIHFTTTGYELIAAKVYDRLATPPFAPAPPAK